MMAGDLPSTRPQASTSKAPASFAMALTSYLEGSYLASLCPTRQEYLEKETLRVRLEGLAARSLPGVKLKPFGSTANGLSLRNSDMDLCCLLPPEAKDFQSPAELVEILGTAIQQQTNYIVKMLPRARIPIIKLTIPASANSPFGMSCDIGFDNRLALHNTRLLLSYVQLDPRIRPMILFIKVWTKRRKINNPYLGTLSSYGYVLLVLSFLVHIRVPPVLPNLQAFPPRDRVSLNDIELDGHDVYFNDDVAAIKSVFGAPNAESLGDLLVAFFHYYAHDFRYSWDVVSLRSEKGILTKEQKGWLRDNDTQSEHFGGSRDLNRICIEDPFQTAYNVARTVTKDGLYTIRGELMRAARTLNGRNENIASLVADLCEERAEEALMIAPPGTGGNRRRSAPSPRLSPAIAPTSSVAIPQSANDFRRWVEANSNLTGVSVGNAGQFVLDREVISESGEPSPNLPPVLPPPHGYGNHFNPRTMTFQHRSTGASYQPLRGYSRGSRGPLSPPVLERRLSWDGPRQNGHAIAQETSSLIPRYGESPVSGAQTAPASPRSTVLGQNKPPPEVTTQGKSSSYRHAQGQQGVNSNGSADPTGLSPALIRAAPSEVSSEIIHFGNFTSSNGLGLFRSLSQSEELQTVKRPISRYVEQVDDVIVFGDVPVIRKLGNGQMPTRSANAYGPGGSGHNELP